MAYTYEPDELAAAYRPLMFRRTVTSTASVERLEVRFYTFGSLYATFRTDYYDNTGGTYSFDIDVQAGAQRYLKPRTTAITSFLTDPVSTVFSWDQNTDAYVEYSIQSDVLYRDTDGLLVTSAGSTLTSNDRYAIAATRPVYQVGMTDYYFQSTASQFKFLTDGPLTQSVAEDETFALSFIGKSIDATRLRFYNSAGALQSTHIVDITSINPTIPGIVTLYTGPANILGGGSPTFLLGTSAFPTDLSAYAYYTVDVGDEDGATYTAYSESMRLNLVGRCAGSRRFYWFNSLGGADQYTFTGRVVKRTKTGGDLLDMSLVWTPSNDPQIGKDDRGLVKTGITSDVYLEITEVVDPDTAALLHSMCRSPEVYMELNGDRVAVLVDGIAQDLDDTARPYVEFKLSVLIERQQTQAI